MVCVDMTVMCVMLQRLWCVGHDCNVCYVTAAVVCVCGHDCNVCFATTAVVCVDMTALHFVTAVIMCVDMTALYFVTAAARGGRASHLVKPNGP